MNDIDLDIGKMVRKKLIRKSLDLTTSLPRELRNKKRERWIRIPYLGKFSSQLSRVLRPFGFRLVFYNPFTLNNLVVKLKDRIPNNQKSGVYSLKCEGCDGVYIGETSRQLKLRVTEHLKSWRNGSLGESAFADHLIISGHSFTEGSESLIHHESSFFKRLALENIEIVRHSNRDDLTVLNRILPEDGFIEIAYGSIHDASQNST